MRSCATTWASLSISIDEKPVTEVLDSRTKSVRSRVFLPLFPLAEWIADNWWFLQTETEGRDSPRSIDFDRRHNLRWAREGFALPSVRFVTLGDNVAVQWAPLDIPDAAIRFLSSGSEVLPTRTFIAELHEFVDAVITRLDESGVTGTTLHEQWTAIEIADAAERKFCRAAARLGADPYAIDDQLQQAILDVAASIRHDLLDDFLSLANPGILKNQADAMKSASESIEADADRVDALRAMRDRKPALNADGNPWEMGYRFAAQLRQTLNGGEWKSRSLDELAGHLSIDQLDHCLLPETNKRQLFEALAGANKCNSPKFLIEKKRQDSRQFAFCRAPV